MKKVFFTIFSITLLCMPDMNAQVRIGSDQPPEEFAVLQIDGTRQGLRLPRLTQSQKSILSVDANAAGLMIYNSDTRKIEYYNGNEWKTIGTQIYSFGNGVSFDNSANAISLGGSLRENTEIDMKEFQLNFSTANNGSFSVNTDDLLADKNNLSANVNSFGIKGNSGNDVLQIVKNGTGNKLTIKSGLFSVNKGKLKVVNDTVNINGLLTYLDSGGTYGEGKILMSANEYGDAYWGVLQVTSVSKQFAKILGEGQSSINAGGFTTYLPTGDFTPVTSTLTLTPGKWFIAGLLYTYTYNTATNGNNNYSTMIRIYDTTNGKTLFLTGEQPEAKAAATGNNEGAYSAIPLKHIIVVEQGQQIDVRIDVHSQTAKTYLTKNVDWLCPNRGSYFQAIRVND